MKIQKGKNTGRIEAIVKRHMASEKLPSSLVKAIDNKTWAVTSSDNQREYIVEQESDKCGVNCAMRCECNICVHMYCCNCADALIHHTICKHTWWPLLLAQTDHRHIIVKIAIMQIWMKYLVHYNVTTKVIYYTRDRKS